MKSRHFLKVLFKRKAWGLWPKSHMLLVEITWCFSYERDFRMISKNIHNLQFTFCSISQWENCQKISNTSQDWIKDTPYTNCNTDTFIIWITIKCIIVTGQTFLKNIICSAIFTFRRVHIRGCRRLSRPFKINIVILYHIVSYCLISFHPFYT